VKYRLWVNWERTLMVRMWDDGTVEVAKRSHTWDAWGPPVTVDEEKVS
jgi:hypothetical protein